MKVYDVTVENADQPGLTETDADSQTNTVTANSSSTGTNTVESVAAKKSPPPFDPMLDETERILLDYISLLGKKNPLIANQ